MRYLVTGHTGFKGSWLTMMLKNEGHHVTGVALAPPEGGLYRNARLGDLIDVDLELDIRDADTLATALVAAEPEVVVHLAAQPLVRRSYVAPRETIDTNVMGTLNVLAASRTLDSLRAQLIITTDKVYRNVGQAKGYVESDALGGRDPYSASKAMADILTQSWVASFPGAPTAVARAGNVIGGGDVSVDRLLPDLLDGYAAGRPVNIRNPGAVRPWQHVLDCLAGYRSLVDALLAGTGTGEWNFGPGPESFVPVGELADIAAGLWGGSASWTTDSGSHPHEAELLALDSSKSLTQLDWHNRLVFPESVEWTVEWQRRVLSGENPRDVSMDQLDRFTARA